MMGVYRLRFCIRGKHSILSCNDEVVRWEGGVFSQRQRPWHCGEPPQQLGQLQLGRVYVWRGDEDAMVLGDDGDAGGGGEVGGRRAVALLGWDRRCS